MKTLVFTIATNGYDAFLADHIASQRRYAARHGYEHIALTKTPPWGISAANSSWLKIPMMLHYLRSGFDRVLWIDADARVMPRAPSLDAMQEPGKSVFLSKEDTGRYNAGVFLCLAHPDAESFIRRIYLLADWPGIWIPRQDPDLYENGHLNWVARGYRHCIHTIDPRWNVTVITTIPDPEEAYILHGQDSLHRKPRSLEKPPSRWLCYWRRIAQGPRTLLLWRLARWYAKAYPIG